MDHNCTMNSTPKVWAIGEASSGRSRVRVRVNNFGLDEVTSGKDNVYTEYEAVDLTRKTLQFSGPAGLIIYFPSCPGLLASNTSCGVW